MIKPINITPLNTSNTLVYKCERCGAAGTMKLENSIINTDNESNPIELLEDYDCPECGEKL